MQQKDIALKVRIISSTGKETFLPEATLEEFKKSLRGKLIYLKDTEYDQARKIYNAMIDKHPALIVRCAGAADVVASVNFARKNNLLVAVHCAGHNVAGNSVCEGGIVIDLSAYRRSIAF
jgi:FAD/FMN-containing dehydrogenase